MPKLQSMWFRVAFTLCVFAAATAAVADDAYYQLRIADLKFPEGSNPDASSRDVWRFWRLAQAMHPYVVIDGQGEAYVPSDPALVPTAPLPGVAVSDAIWIHTTQARDITGRLFYPKADRRGMVVVKFTIPAADAKAELRGPFYEAKKAYYRNLMTRNLPGAAWFRHEARQAEAAQGNDAKQPSSDEAAAEAEAARRQFGQGDDLTQSYALFSGGRAVSENLQLDRVLRGVKAEEPSVALDSLGGISVPEIDWKPLIKDLKPELDPLAAQIPADQHAVFFPTFSALVAVADQWNQRGIPVFQQMPRSDDLGDVQRYERQLGLSLTGLGRVVGPRMVASVALTGSDPYFRTGTDVAVLFESATPKLLANLVWAQINLAASKQPGAKPEQGEVAGVAYHGIRLPDRTVCSYLAQVNRAVIVTNSLYQLEQLVKVGKKESPSIASLPEYVFFRDRYRLDAPEETALFFLSDATIRRWCGPRWRIATSRRIRAMAVMAELQASQLDALVQGTIQPGPVGPGLATADIGELTIDASGVHASIQGSLDFMTPIAEIPLSKVTKSEAEAYQQWRDGYQRNWRWAFDPIALRVTLGPKQLAADLTVMPLIAASEYRDFIAISEGARFAPDAGDPHDALAHLILAINPKSSRFVQADNFIGSMSKGGTLGWLGSSVALFADDDPVWQEFVKLADEDLENFERTWSRQIGRLPVGVRAEVSNGLHLAAFLASLRAFVEQTAPGMVQWESLTYKDQPYVKVTPTERAKGQTQELRDIAIYYAASGDAFLVTLNEGVLKRSIDRQLAGAGAKTDSATPSKSIRPWLGSNVGLQIDRKVIEVINLMNRRSRQDSMQVAAWNALPVLNEWKRRYPDLDPMAVHERVWHVKLTCPGGGRYVWNDAWQTMESTVYGHPGEPKEGPVANMAFTEFANGSFGLTFENQGLRARISFENGEVDKKPESDSTVK